MSEHHMNEKTFFEQPLYRIGFPILVFALIGLLYYYSVNNPITDEATVLKAFPTAAPSYNSGKDIFEFFCIGCHSKDGTPAKGLTFEDDTGKRIAPAVLSDPDFIHRHAPLDMFAAVSNGRGTVMPGFKKRISEAKRWDVSMYTYLLNLDPEDITTGTGRELYESNCIQCHGEGGKGDGEKAQAENPVLDLTDLKMMVTRTDNSLIESVKNNIDGNHTASIQGVSDEDLFKVLGYIRTLGLSDADEIEAISEEEQTSTDETTPDQTGSE